MAIEALDLTEARYDLLAGRTKKREVGPIPGMPTSSGMSSFKAAAFNRLTADWATSILSADQELWSDLRRLRARSRSLAKNNHYAKKFLSQVEKNVIGSQGITFQAKVKKQRGEGLIEATNKELKRAWEDWSKPENCTVEGKLSWAGVQRFFIRMMALDGEVLIRKVPLAGNPHLFALQFIDPDQLDATFMLASLPNGNEIRMGVEVDQYRRPVAYHLWKRHPSEFTSNPQQRIRVPASEIIHAFIPERVGQTRGIPWMSASMLEMQMLAGYKEAEVVAARLGACKMGFFTSEIGETYTGDPDVSGAAVGGQPGTPRANAEPGVFESLPAGMKFESYNPEHPNSNYGSFTKDSLRGISSGLDMPYHELGSDLESINFSSIRAGLLDSRDRWRILQQMSRDTLCQPVYSAWLPNSILAGGLILDAQNISIYSASSEWHPRGWDWVDPYKDAMASVLAIENGLSTLTRDLAEQGLDIEDVLTERKVELDRISELGIKIGTDAKGVADTASDDQSASQSEGGSGNKDGEENTKALDAEYARRLGRR